MAVSTRRCVYRVRETFAGDVQLDLVHELPELPDVLVVRYSCKVVAALTPFGDD
jgi:hypothetical protein